NTKATEIYARAYTQNPQAAEFYNFLKSMDTYRKVLTKDTTLVFSTDSDLFGLLKRASAKPQTLPPARYGILHPKSFERRVTGEGNLSLHSKPHIAGSAHQESEL